VVLSPQAFKETTNGYEKASNGLWTHRGHAVFAADRPAAPGNSGGWQSNIEIRSPASLPAGPAGAGNPAIGFHEPSVAGVALYKPAGQIGLRIAGSDGSDYPVAGAPGSVTGAMIADGTITFADLANGAATVLLIDAAAYSNFSTTLSGQWVETPINGSGNFGGPLGRIDCVTTLIASASCNGYIGWGWDGAVSASMLIATLQPGQYMPMHAFVYTTPPSAGTHKMSLFIHNASASTTFGLSNAIPSRCSVMEFRR